MLEIGDKAPNFKVKCESEELISLSQLKGKNVVLYFYPKDSTPGCTIQAQDFSKHIKEFENASTVILGVSRDSIKSHLKFIEKQNIKFNLLSDEDGALCEKFGVIKEKSMFGKKYMGIERSTFLIDKIGKIAKIWRSVKVKSHIDEVLKSTKEL